MRSAKDSKSNHAWACRDRTVECLWAPVGKMNLVFGKFAGREDEVVERGARNDFPKTGPFCEVP